MFTGLVQAVGSITARDDAMLVVKTGALSLAGLKVGDSIAVSGVCLTATTLDARGIRAEVSDQTRAATTLGALGVGARVNLERALTLADPLGGHLVSGHVDGVGGVLSVTPAGDSRVFRIRVPDDLARYVARKGSVCVDGVSLTVNAVDGSEFEVNLIPHTLENTTLGDLATGAAVNIEVDMLARYLERLLEHD
ncbi:MAG: riboflavin synthase [Gammaproteobacteria bacterium]